MDSFGRTRKCPKEDLPHMMAAERRRERGKEREKAREREVKKERGD